MDLLGTYPWKPQIIGISDKVYMGSSDPNVRRKSLLNYIKEACNFDQVNFTMLISFVLSLKILSFFYPHYKNIFLSYAFLM